MSVLSWNCRGLGNPQTVQEIAGIVTAKKPMFIFLIETKVRIDHAEKLKFKIGFEGLVYVDGGGVRGGLVLLWKDKEAANLLSFSLNHIDVEVNLESMSPWRLTCFYGSPNRARRTETWNLLRSLSTRSTLPWVVIGDFNDLCAQSEKRGALPHPVSLINGFNEVLEECGLEDLGMKGYRFTWENGHDQEDWIEERLDRVVATNTWYNLYSHASVTNLDVVSSDHSAIFMDIEKPVLGVREYTFRFENAWLINADCRDIIVKTWGNSVGVNFEEMLARYGQSLKDWGGEDFANFGRHIRFYKYRRKVLRGRRDVASTTEFKDVSLKLKLLLAQQAAYWKQRSKHHWLKDGDKNTKFFHKSATARKAKNRILSLRDENGLWVEGAEFRELIHRYYTSIFTSSGSVGLDCLSGLTPRVTQRQNDELGKPFTEEEVKGALFSMFPDKMPGPDGFNPGFYQHYWPELGTDLTAFILDCINNQTFSHELNDATIVLIPKKHKPEEVGELRPIALCNVTYKIMAKMISKRIKSILGGIISEAQSAFIPGRLISDNILLASEVGHFLSRKRDGILGWAALKLDMAKAYDKMEWSFLEAMLCRLGFEERWINLIMLCVTTVRYKILVDGIRSDFIVPTRGLRQGDPLSPFLFIICAEGLSYLLQQAELTSGLRGCCIARGAPIISHLFFADDSLLFLRALEEDAVVVKTVLFQYECMSGQTVNYHKSSICFSRNTSYETRNSLAAMLGVVLTEGLGKYLGLPMCLGRNKSGAFNYIEKKIRQRIGGWTKRLLSKAGKEILIKSVAQSMPTYTMSIYLLPRGFCTNLERIMNKYWWGTNDSSRGIHWFAWDRLSTPKKFGGLGFRKLHEFNVALLGKQAWRILSKPDSLMARLFKARYFPDCGFLDADSGSNPSFCWKSLLASQELLSQGCRRRIGNGKTTSVWKEPWLPDRIKPCISTAQPYDLVDLKVAALIDPTTQDWDLDFLHLVFNNRDVSLISQVPVCTSYNDEWIWTDDIRGYYGVKQGYRRLMGEFNQSPVAEFSAWTQLWKLPIPPKVRCFLWRCVRNILPVKQALLSRRVATTAECPLCQANLETQLHIFFECPLVQALWNDVYFASTIQIGVSFGVWLQTLMDSRDELLIRKSTLLIWCIWKARNEKVWSVWKNKRFDLQTIKISTVTLVNDLLLSPTSNVANSLSTSTATASTVPPDLTFLCRVDAAVFKTEGKASYGAVLWDGDGRFLAARNGPVSCVNDVYTAEAMAVKEALSWLKAKNFRNVIVESDAQLVVHNLNRSGSDLSIAGCVLSDCSSLFNYFDYILVRFINRSLNSVAHTLARDAKFQAYAATWDVIPPLCIHNQFD